MDITQAPSLLLKDSPEVLRSFEDNYVINEFKKYRSQNIPDNDIVTFFHRAQLSGANPVLDDIYLTPRSVKVKVNGRDEYRTVGTILYNYNFLRKKVSLSGKHGGTKVRTEVGDYFDPIKGESVKMLKAVATCIVDGVEFEYTAWWEEYVQKGQYGITAQWKSKPYVMLSKCAEAGVLRMAYPEWSSGIYTAEEMGAIEKDNSVLEAEFEIQEQSEKKKEIQERIDQKEENKENEEEISTVLSEIRGMMVVLCEGMNPTEKGKFMFGNLNVRSFKDLEKESLESLQRKLNLLVDMHKKTKEKPSFVLGE